METIAYKTIDGTFKVDKNELLLLVLGSVNESVWDSDHIDVAKLKMIISAFVDHPDITKRVAILALDNEKVAGLIAGTITDDGLLGKPMASELIWYVSPRYRKTQVASKLITGFERWARDQGTTYVTMSHYNNELGDILSKVYEKKGFRKMESTYFKELK